MSLYLQMPQLDLLKVRTECVWSRESGPTFGANLAVRIQSFNRTGPDKSVNIFSFHGNYAPSVQNFTHTGI